MVPIIALLGKLAASKAGAAIAGMASKGGGKGAPIKQQRIRDIAERRANMTAGKLQQTRPKEGYG